MLQTSGRFHSSLSNRKRKKKTKIQGVCVVNMCIRVWRKESVNTEEESSKSKKEKEKDMDDI
jgi:hypothetical protein